MERMETMDKNYIHRHLKSHFVAVKSSLSQYIYFRPRHKGLRLCIYKCKLGLKFRLHRLALHLEIIQLFVSNIGPPPQKVMLKFKKRYHANDL